MLLPVENEADESAIATKETIPLTMMSLQEESSTVSKGEEEQRSALSPSSCSTDDQPTILHSTDQVEPSSNGSSDHIMLSPSPLSHVCSISDDDDDAGTATTHQIPPSNGPVLLRRIPSQIRLALLSLKRDHATAWEDMEDDLYILLNGNVQHLHEFRILFWKLHDTLRTQQSATLLLRSLAYLCSQSANDMAAHDEHMSRVAYFLSIGRDTVSIKLEVLTTLVTCHSPPDASWQLKQEVVRGTFDFLITPDMEWEFMDGHTAMTLLYELRAKCVRAIAVEQERIRRVAETGDEAAVLISAGAKLVELGIQRSNKVLEGHIDSAGKKMKGWVEVDKDPLLRDRDAVVAMAFSDTAKRASIYAREGAKAAVSSLCDASISGLHMIGDKFGDKVFTDKLSPEGREILKAAGKVGIATIGAAAIVGEALVETSRGVVSKTADVTADVVGHKYGLTAGEVAKNAAETAENVFRTIGSAALLDGSVLAKKVAKNVGKEQIDKDFEKARETIQILEKHAAALTSQTLGIEWQGNWTSGLVGSNTGGKIGERTIEADAAAPAEKRDNPLPRSGDSSVEKKQTNQQSDEISELPRRSGVEKLIGMEDHSGSDTSSLSSSMGTEPTGYRIARRGKPLQRKRTPLRPDMDPAPSSASSRRRSHVMPSRKNPGIAATHSAVRRSWA
ncbi:senescence-associated protein [Nitzschia inconspicua]|uniref:Senescence-associated protein n=1 Tax=Nitzschia inconspicua TaxID=303405 RepID=A0A9K3LBR5_9STRA|nr:senescence-associated protein [Nitzschia inconspicua]